MTLVDKEVERVISKYQKANTRLSKDVENLLKCVLPKPLEYSGMGVEHKNSLNTKIAQIKNVQTKRLDYQGDYSGVAVKSLFSWALSNNHSKPSSLSCKHISSVHLMKSLAPFLPSFLPEEYSSA